MFVDHAPISSGIPSETGMVIVVEPNDRDVDEIIAMARGEGATSTDGDGEEIFWIVFSNSPRRVDPFTERALRSTINRRQ